MQRASIVVKRIRATDPRDKERAPILATLEVLAGREVTERLLALAKILKRKSPPVGCIQQQTCSVSD